MTDCVKEGAIPVEEADDLFICVGVFIHWEANDDKKIEQYNYEATKLALERAVADKPKARSRSLNRPDKAKHPFSPS